MATAPRADLHTAHREDTLMPAATKTPSASAVHDQVYQVFPNDLNANDTVFGGLIMAQMDRVCAVVAGRHAGGTVVTVSVDAVHFVLPARRGDVLILHATMNRAWRSSMEIGCKVEAESIDGERRHILSAYCTFVATSRDGRPRAVPVLTPETPVEKRRYAEADLRRQNRLRQAETLKASRTGTPATD
ncbi:MAG TPA: acyl-CoA thioesterase [Nevskiaceae bacterium]|nr:acyl-CoA thioesterase [Nevskiaceae bacterium]